MTLKLASVLLLDMSELSVKVGKLRFSGEEVRNQPKDSDGVTQA